MYVLLDGCGTVLNRVARLYLSAGYKNIILTKRTLKNDRRTQELSELCRDYPCDLYLDVPDLKHVHESARTHRLHVKGMRSELPWSDISIVINGMDDQVGSRIIDEYQKEGKLFLLQGGADYNVVKNDFVSGPNAVGHLFTSRFRAAPARHSSCNGVYFATAIGLIQDVWQKEDIAEIRSHVFRRSRDYGESKELAYEPTPTPSHHAVDGLRLVPQLTCPVFSEAQKMPWEPYHRAEITITFKENILDADLQRLKRAFMAYERCVYTKAEVGGSSVERGLEGITHLLRVAADIDIPEGDILLPTYHVKKSGSQSIIISGYNPQRSVIALSVLDWLWIAQGNHTCWKDAFEYTNRAVVWHGYVSLHELKQQLEERINWSSPDMLRVSER